METNMYYLVETDKEFDQAATDLDAAVKRNGFGGNAKSLKFAIRSKPPKFWKAICA